KKLMKLFYLLLVLSLVDFSSSAFSQPLPKSMLDTSFSYDGKVVTKEASGDSSHASINGLVLQSDGKIIAAGTSQKDDYSTSKIVLTRYLPDGKLDHSFGNKGVFYTNYKDYGISNLIDIKQQASGKMVAIGYAYSIQNGVIPLLFRFNKDGSIDNSFGDSGWTILPEEGNSIAIQFNDGIIITSERATKGRDTLILRRYKKNGIIDSVFGKNSIAMAIAKGIQGGGVYPVVAIDKLSRIVAGFTGASNKSSVNDIVVARFTENGLADSSFNKIGIVIIDNKNSPEYLNAITLQSDNRILVGGESYLHGDFLIARLNENGTVDSSFGGTGKVTINFRTDENWGSTDYVTGLIIQGNKIVATGTSDQILYGKTFALARLFADGRPDKSFGFNGKILTRFLLGNAVLNVSILQPDGKIICGGSAQKGNNSGQEDFAIARYLQEKDTTTATFIANKTINVSSQLSLYPNPCIDKIFVNGLQTTTATVFIKDQLGNIVQKNILSKANNYQVPISSLKAGFYFLVVIEKSKNSLLKFYKE
ncbi:MAG: T9SS type A sorting domain-containing protein, partial [Parafilimonas sp.]